MSIESGFKTSFVHVKAVLSALNATVSNIVAYSAIIILHIEQIRYHIINWHEITWFSPGKFILTFLALHS